MSPCNRRSLLSTFTAVFPLSLAPTATATAGTDPAPRLGFRPVEDAVREAFARQSRGGASPLSTGCTCRVEIGPSGALLGGLPGRRNSRPFAGFPAGQLRIVRTSTEPGPIRHGVRLYVTTVEIAWTGERSADDPGHPLDFATLPPAPALS